MADISFARTFKHEDWIDNEDVVQAGGEKGFNDKFHAIEDDFDGVSKAITDLNTEIKNIQQLKFVQAQSTQTLDAEKATAEFVIEDYSPDDLPASIDKAYFVVITPVSGTTYVQHTLLYRDAPGNMRQAAVVFYNPGPSQARFSFRILELSVQTS